MIDLRATIERYGITQARIARVCGVRHQAVTNWLNKSIPLDREVQLLRWFKRIKLDYVKTNRKD